MIKLINKPKPTLIWTSLTPKESVALGTRLQCHTQTYGIAPGTMCTVRDQGISLIQIETDNGRWDVGNKTCFSILKEISP